MFNSETQSVCVVLPTYNRRQVLEHTIASYLALRCRLLVIDDGSNDGTQEWLLSLGVQVIRHPNRRGLPAARNTGLRMAHSDWVLFGEDDVIFHPLAPQQLLRAAHRLPRSGAVAGKLYAGTTWALPDQEPTIRKSQLLDFSTCLADFSAVISQPRVLPSLHACALIHRQTALTIGGYDNSFTNSAFREESDFYARLWQAGFAAWLIPETWAVHVRHSLGGGCRGARDLAAKAANRGSYLRNNGIFIDRHANMWRRWGNCPGSGSLKARFAWRMLGSNLANLRKNKAENFVSSRSIHVRPKLGNRLNAS